MPFKQKKNENQRDFVILINTWTVTCLPSGHSDTVRFNVLRRCESQKENTPIGEIN